MEIKFPLFGVDEKGNKIIVRLLPEDPDSGKTDIPLPKDIPPDTIVCALRQVGNAPPLFWKIIGLNPKTQSAVLKYIPNPSDRLIELAEKHLRESHDVPAAKRAPFYYDNPGDYDSPFLIIGSKQPQITLAVILPHKIKELKDELAKKIT